jgi:hypothetical protein
VLAAGKEERSFSTTSGLLLRTTTPSILRTSSSSITGIRSTPSYNNILTNNQFTNNRSNSSSNNNSNIMKSSILPSFMTTTTTTTTRRSFASSYEPLTPDEEQAEKVRVANLTPFAKEQELRQYNRELARLEILRGINTGERYTWTGQYKFLARNYGLPLVMWYWTCFGTSFVLCWITIEVGGFDAMTIVSQVDAWLDWNMTSRIDPTYGKIGMALVMNEMLEPLRLPFVILTVKPVVDRLFPSKF